MSLNGGQWFRSQNCFLPKTLYWFLYLVFCLFFFFFPFPINGTLVGPKAQHDRAAGSGLLARKDRWPCLRQTTLGPRSGPGCDKGAPKGRLRQCIWLLVLAVGFMGTLHLDLKYNRKRYKIP